jgi:hypothetical protein
MMEEDDEFRIKIVKFIKEYNGTNEIVLRKIRQLENYLKTKGWFTTEPLSETDVYHELPIDIQKGIKSGYFDIENIEEKLTEDVAEDYEDDPTSITNITDIIKWKPISEIVELAKEDEDFRQNLIRYLNKIIIKPKVELKVDFLVRALIKDGLWEEKLIKENIEVVSSIKDILKNNKVETIIDMIKKSEKIKKQVIDYLKRPDIEKIIPASKIDLLKIRLKEENLFPGLYEQQNQQISSQNQSQKQNNFDLKSISNLPPEKKREEIANLIKTKDINTILKIASVSNDFKKDLLNFIADKNNTNKVPKEKINEISQKLNLKTESLNFINRKPDFVL